MHIEHLDNNLSLIYVCRQKIDQFIGLFSKYVLYNDNKDIFYSLTTNQNEISLIVDSSIAIKFESIKQIETVDFGLIKIYNDHDGIDDIGTVNKISSYFKNNNISILYVNSFNNNYVIYDKKDMTKVNNILNIMMDDENKNNLLNIGGDLCREKNISNLSDNDNDHDYNIICVNNTPDLEKELEMSENIKVCNDINCVNDTCKTPDIIFVADET